MEIERTLDDASPAIIYSGTWQTDADNDPVNAGDKQEYYRGTLHRTYKEGDSIRFIFQGNAIYFIGTTGPNNGNYTVQYDNGQVEMFTGYSENRRSRQMLYNRGNAGEGNHEVLITNVPIPAPNGGNGTLSRLDLDMIQIVSIDSYVYNSLACMNELIIRGDITTKVLDNTDPTVKYSDGWRVESADDRSYRNGSVHSTNGAQSSVTIPFTGSSIAVYGTLDAVKGGFQATIDGNQDQQKYNAYRQDYMADVPLYTIGELENKDHTLVITNAPNGVLVNLNFDYAVVNYTTPTSSSSPNFKPGVAPGAGSSGADSGTGKSGNGSNVGVIAGAVGGAVGAILLGIAIWYFCCRRRRGQGKNGSIGKGGSGSGLMGMVGLGSRSREPKTQGVRPYEVEKADSASHISHLAPGHGPTYLDNRRPSSNGSTAPRRMSIDSPPHLGSQLHTPRTFTDTTLAGTYQPAILDDLPKQGLGIFNPGREGSVSESSLYSQIGQTLHTEGLTREQRDTLLQAILNNPALLNGSSTNIAGGSYFAPSVAASSGVMPAYGKPAPGMSIAPSSNAVPSPIQTRHAPGFGRPTSRDGATSDGGMSSIGDNGPLPFVLDIGGAAARVRAQQAHGTPPVGVPQSVSGRGDDMASTAFPQSVDGGSVIGDPTPFPHALSQRDRTAMTPPQSSTTAYTGLGPNTPETANPARALLSGWNSNEKGTVAGTSSAAETRAGSPLKTAPVIRPAPPTLNVPQPGEGEGGQQFTPGYVRDHKIPLAMAQDGQESDAGAGGSGSDGQAAGENSSGVPGASVGSNTSGSHPNLAVDGATGNSGSRPQSRFSMAFGSRDDHAQGVEGGEVPPDYAQVLAESQHGSPSRARPGR